MEKIIIIGGGFHAECVIATIREERLFDIVGVLDESKSGEVAGVPVLGGDDKFEELKSSGIVNAFPGAVLGAKADTRVGERVFQKIKKAGFNIPTIVSSKAVVRADVKMGEGCLVQPTAVVDVAVELGDGVVVNPKALIGHHCKVDDFVVFAGGCVLNADLKIGRSAFIGMGANVFSHVGAECKVAPGTTVMQELPAKNVAYQDATKVMPRLL